MEATLRTRVRQSLAVLGSVVILGPGCAAGGDGERTNLVVLAVGSPLRGAIFTTTADGASVDANIYAYKDAVYLDGGPGPRAPVGAAGLPAGDYYFQVTDPSGAALLSSDHISCRRVHVNDLGVIDHAYPGTSYVYSRGAWRAVPCQHLTGIDSDHAQDGAVTVQLSPYDDTPNRGGVYKAWMTPVGQYAGNPNYAPVRKQDAIHESLSSQGSFFGFRPAASNTDNYKVARKGRPVEPMTLSVDKFHDPNVDGVKDDTEAAIAGWRVTVVDPLGGSNDYYTPFDVLAAKGTHLVIESVPADTVQTVSYLDGALQSEWSSADPIVSVVFDGYAGEHHDVLYGNVGLGRITACKRLDRDGDGVIAPEDPAVAGFRMELSGTTVNGLQVDPLVRATAADGCVLFADLLPGAYIVRELLPEGSTWQATANTSEIFDIESVLAGDVLGGTLGHVDFANLCTLSADFDTKGYWHNKNGLTELDAGDIAYANALPPYATASSYFGAGDEPFDGKYGDGTAVPAALGISGEIIAPAGTAAAEVSHFLVDPNANANTNQREQLAQQLLAFVWNVRNRLDDPAAAIAQPDGSFVTAGGLIAEAVAVWLSGTAAERDAMAQRLDDYNNAGSVAFIPRSACPITYP